MPDSPARGRRGPTNLRDTSNVRVQKPTGLPPIYEDWTPDAWRLDPRNTRIGSPTCGDHRTPEGQGLRTGRRPRLRKTEDWTRNPGLRGIRDFMGFKTLRDPGLCRIQDFLGPRTSWDSTLRGTRDFVGSRTLQKTGTLYASDKDLVLWCSLREHKLSG